MSNFKNLLPTTPLPINVVTGGMLYMYSCSQCDFKTHVESMFKQHVDSVHLGIPNVPANAVLGQNTMANLPPGTALIAAANPSVSLEFLDTVEQSVNVPLFRRLLVELPPVKPLFSPPR